VFNGGGQRLWEQLDPSEREQHKAVASSRRKISAARLSELGQHLETIEQEKQTAPGGPWNICSELGPHSVHRDIISREYEAKGTMAAFEKSWTARVIKETIPAEGFPTTVVFDGPFNEDCSSCARVCTC